MTTLKDSIVSSFIRKNMACRNASIYNF